MSIILAIALLLIMASIIIAGAAWLVKKAMDLLIGKGSDALPASIEEARAGTMLLRSMDHETEYTEVLSYDGGTDTYFMEQRAANYMQDTKYTCVEFKDVEGKTHRYDLARLREQGWSIN